MLRKIPLNSQKILMALRENKSSTYSRTMNLIIMDCINKNGSKKTMEQHVKVMNENSEIFTHQNSP
jgi:hypothetical protein